ncbi:unnamed protein product [Discosporangium mesarthrocarpum]
MDLSHSRVGNCGHPRGVPDVRQVPSLHRTSYHTWAAEAGVALSTLWDLCKLEEARSVRRWIKPVLSDAHNLERVEFFCAEPLVQERGNGVGRGEHVRLLHVDEKWFYVKRDGGIIYLHPDEAVPNPPCAQKKRNVTEIMLLVFVARPRKLSDGSWFDGKIGIWPVVETVAQENSKTPRGYNGDKTGDHGRGKVPGTHG